MPYQDAFPRFTLDVEIPAGFVDCSNAQDEMPHWEHQEYPLALWIADAAPENWEIAERMRFALYRTGNPEQDANAECKELLIETDDWDALERALASVLHRERNFLTQPVIDAFNQFAKAFLESRGEQHDLSLDDKASALFAEGKRGAAEVLTKMVELWDTMEASR